MDDQKNTQLSELIGRVMIEADLESPPSDFTKNLMERIELLKTNEKLVYRPLISKKGLFLIAAVFLSILAYAYFLADFETANSWLGTVDSNRLMTNFELPVYSFEFSKAAMYAIVLLGAMILIQTSLLKKHFDSRLT